MCHSAQPARYAQQYGEVIYCMQHLSFGHYKRAESDEEQPTFSIFAKAASPRSMPQTSAKRTVYRRQSASSSATLCLSAGENVGRPGPAAASPFHWNSAASSPTSPVCVSSLRAMHTEVWNLSDKTAVPLHIPQGEKGLGGDRQHLRFMHKCRSKVGRGHHTGCRRAAHAHSPTRRCARSWL